MTPSDLHALARVLEALLPHRTVDQLVDAPQEAHARAERLETAGRPTCPRGSRRPRLSARGMRQQGSRAATNGSATGAACCLTQPVFRLGGGHKPAVGRALSRPRQRRAERGQP